MIFILLKNIKLNFFRDQSISNSKSTYRQAELICNYIFSFPSVVWYLTLEFDKIWIRAKKSHSGDKCFLTKEIASDFIPKEVRIRNLLVKVLVTLVYLIRHKKLKTYWVWFLYRDNEYKILKSKTSN